MRSPATLHCSHLPDTVTTPSVQRSQAEKMVRPDQDLVTDITILSSRINASSLHTLKLVMVTRADV